MKPTTLKVLDDPDEEFVERLIIQGMKPVVARTLVFLKGTESGRHREIELGTRMSQQDVSRALREMRRNEWVTAAEVKQVGKRSYMRYTLVVDVSEIVSAMERDVRADVVRIESDIAELKAFDLDEVIE